MYVYEDSGHKDRVSSVFIQRDRAGGADNLKGLIMEDNWEQEPVRTPTTISRFAIRLFDTYEGLDEELNPIITQSARYEFVVVDQNGEFVKEYAGDIVPFLTSGQISAAQQFMTDMRAKAEAEVL